MLKWEQQWCIIEADGRVQADRTYRLHSLIFPVSSSSCLDCLLESLILSIFWNPFLQQASKKKKIPHENQSTSEEATRHSLSASWLNLMPAGNPQLTTGRN
jgi:hypothetical protein